MLDSDYWSLAESRVVREREYAANPVRDVIPSTSHAANLARRKRAELLLIVRRREEREADRDE